jgi:hypothetical protein
MMKTLQLLLVFLFSTVLLQAQDAAETAAGVYNEGLELLKSKEYAQAYDKMLKAIELADPAEDAQVLKLAKGNGSIAAYYAGSDLLKEKKFDEAMAKFDKGIELNAKSYTNYYGKAKCKDDQDLTADAVMAYIKAGEVATAGGKGDRAEKYLSRAANIIGLAYGAKKYDDAIAAGDVYLAEQESAEVSYYVAKSLIEKGNASDAIAHAEKASNLGDGMEEGKYTLALAEAYEAAGNKSAAAQAYGKVPKGKYYDHAQYKAGELVK